jgi:hypothetical protein
MLESLNDRLEIFVGEKTLENVGRIPRELFSLFTPRFEERQINRQLDDSESEGVGFFLSELGSECFNLVLLETAGIDGEVRNGLLDVL